MNPLFQQLMADATRSTRGGRLGEATEAIQRALRGAAAHAHAQAAGASVAGPPPVFRGAPGPAADPRVLDGLVREVHDPNAAGEAREARRPASTAPLQGCGEQWQSGSFSHQNRALAYRLYLPPEVPGDGAPRPMVVMLHGCTQHAEDFAAGTRMNALARELGVVVLYPEQTQRANAQKCWNWFKPQHQQRGRGEPAVIAALARSIATAHRVDPARVYVAGLSAGGAMADVVGHCYPDVFAAVGVHSGLPYGCAADVASALSAMRSGPGPAPGATTGARSTALPTIVFHGDADTTVHVRNAESLVAALRSGSGRGAASGAAAAPRVTRGQSGRGARHTRTVYTDAAGRDSLEYWQLHGAGHAWSGGSASGSYTDPSGVDASAEMLRFFLAHPRAAR
ncbi:PHB depolymerase family esterase [Paracidovorax citrulli]|nr:PHB depolymerase family esterase [Paracidovorax citrulli]UEG47028.1 PHB depolymerase family esterase [Paracidovorax citrulli]UMT81993.1 PHB depolymerase family esterase [Paracidovorax citrulli]UMT89687.1 PHB depolymerase family esterase [Paracidovorax citrulli]UMT93767.1 PHB depolymerase family esterase [Paracidovorax citrulli]WIY30217.1 PHB depolymerase family esterase [Paracidovorax citrulli]